MSHRQTNRWTHGRRAGRTLVLLLVAVALVLLVGLGYGAVQMRSSDDSAAQNVPTYTVKQAPLQVKVSESGTIRAREQLVIKSEVEGNSTILYLIAEGTVVEEGDLLVELDASSLQDNRVEQEIRVQNADAAFVRAREQLEVARNQAKSDVEQAELDSQFAKQDLEKYKQGEYPKQIKDAENKIIIAEEEVKRADQKVQWSEVLYKEKYISQSELQADELAAKRANLDLDLAKADLDLLKQYTHPRRLAELNSSVRQKDLALERVRRKAKADVVQAEADLFAKQSELERQKTKLAENQEQIAKTKIVAPRDGQVVYATSTQFSWRGNDEPLGEGQQVRERQELIHLPVAGPMVAEVKIHESHRDKIDTGLPVEITVDALPGRSYTGQVIKVAPLPDPTHVFMNPDLKVYKTEILLDQADQSLRTGMSCRADIVVATYDEALFVPIQAVTRVNNLPVAYVKQGGAQTSFEPRVVEVGLDNGRVVRITDGLEAGDVVSLTPPLDPTAAEAVTAEAQDKANSKAPTARSKGSNAAATESPATQPATGEKQQGDAKADGQQRGMPAGVTQEQMDKLRKELESLSPEERRERIKKLREQYSQ